MAWKIYSPEAFPAPGRHPEYLAAFGYQCTAVKAHEWHDIPEMFVEDRWTDFEHARETENPKQTPVKGRMIALRIQYNYNREDDIIGQRGILAADYDALSKEERKVIEERAETMNKKYRKNVINHFEIQYRAKMRGEPGRLTPSAYELECYEFLGLNPPDLTKEANPPAPQVNVVIPNLQELIDAGVAAALAAQKAAPAHK